MSDDCKTCKYLSGDCGHHHVDFEGKVHLDIPSESACNQYYQCMFWERSIESRQDEIRRLKNLIEKHNEQIERLEREIQREKEEAELIEKAARAGMEVKTFVVGGFILEVEKEGEQ